MIKVGSKSNLIYRFFMSDMVEGFFFSALLATICTAGICANMLNLSYKYLASQLDNSFHVDFNWVFWAGMIIVLFYIIRDYVIPRRSFEFDFALVILLQTLVFVGIIAFHNEDYSNIAYAWILPVAYLAGKVAVGRDKEKANSRITVVIYAFMIALFVIAMLDFYNFFKFAKLYGYLPTEEWPGFWSNEIQNRCGMSLALFFMNTSFAYAIMRRKKSPVMLALIMIMLVISQYWGLIVQSRTITLLPVLTLMMVGAMALYEKRKSIPKMFWVILISLIILGVIFVVLMFANNWFGIRHFYKTSTWGKELIENERFIMNRNGFKLILKNPYGKLEPPRSEWFNPHNTFLQYGRVNGIAVLVLVEIFRIITLKDALIMCGRMNKYSYIKYLLIPAFVALNFNFSMDPNGYVQREFLMMLLLVNGIIRGWNEINKGE